MNHLKFFITSIFLLLITPLCLADALATSKVAYQASDKQLNLVYAKVLQALEEDEQTMLITDQKGWLEYRDWNASHQAESIEEPESSPAYWKAMKIYTDSRITYLNTWITVKPQDSWEGEYSDGTGGLLMITNKDGVLQFHLNVVRGPQFNLGDIKGRLKTNQDKGRYSDEGAPKLGHSPGEETWLDFEKLADGFRMVITGTNTEAHHGKKAYFDGTYRRIK